MILVVVWVVVTVVLREMVVIQRWSLGARSQFAPRSTWSNDVGVDVVVIVCTKDTRRREGLAPAPSSEAVLMRIVVLLLLWLLIVCSGMVIALRMMVMIDPALQSAIAGLGHATFHVVHTASHIHRRDSLSKIRGLDAHQRGCLR